MTGHRLAIMRDHDPPPLCRDFEDDGVFVSSETRFLGVTYVDSGLKRSWALDDTEIKIFICQETDGHNRFEPI
jgi:hypothetical protein